MSMQHALEVRAPLIAREVAEFAMRLGAHECYENGSGKRVLKRVASRYLPESWMNRPKRGFGLPMDSWSAAKLLPAARALVLGEDGRLPAWIDRERLSSYFNRLERQFNAYRVWSLFILETWLRTHPCAPVEEPANISSELASDGLYERLLGVASLAIRGSR
jgi:asparagine synthase (glutamine-hydrolysing)